MKKMIVAIAAIAIAGIVNAASVTWTLSALKQSTDSSATASGYLAMIFDASTSLDLVKTAAMSGDAAQLATLANDWKQDTVSTSAGLLRSAANGTYSALDTFSVYAVIFDASTVADAKNFFVTSTASGSIAQTGNNANLSFGTYASQVNAGGSWTAMSVPEPTSGLMLLLGMAGLALRRRRA